MRIVEPTWEYPVEPRFDDMLQRIELAGRCCYKSEEHITPDSAEKFVRMICKRNHVSVLEHVSVTVKVTCSRACSHQLVRHRLAAYSQRSMRYVKPSDPRVICPPKFELPPGIYTREGVKWQSSGRAVSVLGSAFLNTVQDSFLTYRDCIALGVKPEDARFILPIASETEIVVTMNLRMWQHVFKERALNPAAQWEIRGIFKSILEDFSDKLPCVFGDL